MPEMIQEPGFKESWSQTAHTVHEYLAQHVDGCALFGDHQGEVAFPAEPVE